MNFDMHFNEALNGCFRSRIPKLGDLTPSVDRRTRLAYKVNIELLNSELWKQFYNLGTEMVITKSGRHMFPKIEFSITGLEALEEYFVILEFRLSKEKRHKYIPDTATDKGYWLDYSCADPEAFAYNRFFVYSQDPIVGSELMNKTINFKNLKLTNNPALQHNSIVLQSMHKYMPYVWILKYNRLYFAETGLQLNINNLFHVCEKECFPFEITEFIAVTAYHNKKITKLKVDNNPFAKGFRESDISKRKRKLENDNEVLEPCKKQRKEIIDTPDDNESSSDQCGFSIFRPWLLP